jgi:hypothetical protein
MLAPSAAVWRGKLRLVSSLEYKTRRPVEPVSSNTWSMVWHRALPPGSQIVTETYGKLTFLTSVGPLSTVIGTTLLLVPPPLLVLLVPPLLLVLLVPPPPPPHPANRTTSAVTPASMSLFVIAIT